MATTTVATTVTWIGSTYKNKKLSIVSICSLFTNFLFAENLSLAWFEIRLKELNINVQHHLVAIT